MAGLRLRAVLCAVVGVGIANGEGAAAGPTGGRDAIHLLVTLFEPKADAPSHHFVHAAEVESTFKANLRMGAFTSAHVLYEGREGRWCADLTARMAALTAASNTALHCIEIVRQPTYLDLLQYTTKALAGEVVILANPDVLFDGPSLGATRPALWNSSDLLLLSLHNPTPELVERTIGLPQEKAKVCVASMYDRCKLHAPTMRNLKDKHGVYGMRKFWGNLPVFWPHKLENFADEPGDVLKPRAWDGFMFRARRHLPSRAYRAAFFMNHMGAELYFLDVLQDIGFAHVRNACDSLLAYDMHCAKKMHAGSSRSMVEELKLKRAEIQDRVGCNDTHARELLGISDRPCMCSPFSPCH